MFNGIGPPEILLVLGVVLLMFGGKKLPELARGSGKALRIFKSEVKAIGDDEVSSDAKPASVEALESAEADKKPEQG